MVGNWRTYGPFSLDKYSDDAWERHFREQVVSQAGLADASGVYIIATKLRGKTRIRYIGMTHEQGFAREAFSQRNRALVWSPICEQRNSSIMIWLVAKRTSSGRSFAMRAGMKNEAYLLETLFIMHAKAAGHSLINTAKMKSADGIAVEGLFGRRMRGRKPAGLIEISRLLALAPAP